MSIPTTGAIISAPVIIEQENNKSNSTIASTVVPYYGSRAPKQSIIETDRVLFQMMDDIQITIQPELKQEEEKKWNTTTSNQQKLIPARKHNILWKFRIVFSSILILLLVVATVVISELTKDK